MFWKKEKTFSVPEGKRPAIHASICTGEQSIGFVDLKTGKFEEVMLLRNEEDRKNFCKKYQIQEEEIRKEY